VAISRDDHPFLDHDSYVETGMPVEFYEGEFEDAVSEGRLIGRISPDAARRIIAAWERAKVTPPYARDAVVERAPLAFCIGSDTYRRVTTPKLKP
jgi:hypothetical protein